MTQLGREDLTRAATVAAALTLVATLVAVTVHLLAAPEARGILQFTFPDVPRRLTEVGGIFINNVRVLLTIALACGVVQAGQRVDGPSASRLAALVLTALSDFALLACCVGQVVVAGAAIGAYGARSLMTILPHLPFELGAFSLALALYLDARRKRLPLQRVVASVSFGVVLLAAGAFLEVYA